MDIVTVTLNPAWDIIHVAERWRSERLVRAREHWVVPGGKGVNVSRVLARLGHPSLCLILAGSPDAQRFAEALRRERIGLDAFPAPFPIRHNVTLIDSAGFDELHSVAAGGAMDPNQVGGLLAWIVAHFQPDAHLVLAGSFPPGCPHDLAADLVRLCRNHGMRCVVDTHGEALRYALNAGPWAVKVNRDELAHALGLPEQATDDQLVAAARREVLERGVDWVSVTFGARGAAIISRERSFWATPPQTRTMQTTGCGDAFLAGLLVAQRRGNPLDDQIRYAAAVAGAATEVPELGQINPKRVAELARGVLVRPL